MKATLIASVCISILWGSACLAQAPFTAPADSQWQKGANTHRLAQFPRIHPDGRVWFQFEAPRTAQSVVLQIGRERHPMRQDTAGRWNVIIPRAEPGFQAYSFVVDGTSIRDPGSTPFFVNGYVSALEYPASDSDFYMPRPGPHGDTREHWFFSKVTGSWRRMYVYTPPGYEKDKGARYPVLYLQHGGGEDESEWTHSAQANFIMDNLIAAGRARPMIVVMNNGFVNRAGQAAAAGGGGYRRGFADVFQDFLLNDVIPDVDASYRTIPDAKHRALAGLSMGGGQSFYVGLGNPGVYGSVGLFSTGVFGGIATPGGAAGSGFNAEEHIPGLLTRSKQFNDALDLFYISVGERDPRLEATKSAVATFREHGLQVEFASFPGDHEWRAWRKSLEDFAQRLFKN